MSANSLTQGILKYLAATGWRAWRQNSAGVYDANRGFWRKGSGTPGVPDIIGFHLKTGIFIGIEIKYGKDKHSPEQRDFLAQLHRANGISMTVRSVDDFTIARGIIEKRINRLQAALDLVDKKV